MPTPTNNDNQNPAPTTAPVTYQRATNWLETPDEQNEAMRALWAIANNGDRLMRLISARKSGIVSRLNDCMIPLLDDPAMEKLYNELMNILA